MSSGDHLIVAAIDFGTTFSGYAFSLMHEFKKDPTKCSTMTWNAAIGGLQSLKTSTCVLFDDKRKFHSFGFEAEEKYSNLALDDKHHNWLFFRRFKMQLYKQAGLKRNFTLEADNGMTMDAMEVFSAAIRYLKDHLLRKCTEQHSDFQEDDIFFVLTVPAIWTDQAKQFMREAAEKAGIVKEQLQMSLEPEAASLFCKHVPIEKMVSSEKAYNVFKAGSKYIVLDAGGGTIDITVHEVESGSHLKEIHKANGGDWGGTKVDEEFRKMLTDIVGENVFATFSKEHKFDMLELFADFEIKKRTITPKSTDKITFKVPISLSETFRNLNGGKEIKSILENKKKYKGKITWTGDKLRMEADVAKGFYKKPMDNIVHHMKKLIQDESVKDARFILMVGGFSESPILQDAIQRAFPNKKIVVPNEAGLSVLKGAVIFGHAPQTIDFRVCKYTYGIASSTVFNEEIHDESNKFKTSDGTERCGNLFSKHVEIGETVKVGRPQVTRHYDVLEADQKSAPIRLFVSTEHNPMYVTCRSCTFLGSLEIHIPGEGLDRSVSVSLTFSGTELEVEATEDQTKKTVSASFDFLE